MLLSASALVTAIVFFMGIGYKGIKKTKSKTKLNNYTGYKATSGESKTIKKTMQNYQNYQKSISQMMNKNLYIPKYPSKEFKSLEKYERHLLAKRLEKLKGMKSKRKNKKKQKEKQREKTRGNKTRKNKTKKIKNVRTNN